MSVDEAIPLLRRWLAHHQPCYSAEGCDLCLPTQALLDGLDEAWDHPMLVAMERTARVVDAAVERERDAARAQKRAIEDALIHYRIGQETTWGDLYVDWHYVADRMAAALEGEGQPDTAQEGTP